MKEWIEDRYYDVKGFFKMLTRMVKWGWKLRNSYPWDDHYLLEVEVLKMKELLHYFENHGYHSEECENYKIKMKSIRLAIKLGELLLTDNYTKFYELHEKKWGRIEYKSEEITEGRFKGNYLLVSYRNGKPVNKSEEEINEFKKAFEKDDRIKTKHRHWFYNIISKYGECWWD